MFFFFTEAEEVVRTSAINDNRFNIGGVVKDHAGERFEDIFEMVIALL